MCLESKLLNTQMNVSQKWLVDYCWSIKFSVIHSQLRKNKSNVGVLLCVAIIQFKQAYLFEDDSKGEEAKVMKWTRWLSTRVVFPNVLTGKIKSHIPATPMVFCLFWISWFCKIQKIWKLLPKRLWKAGKAYIVKLHTIFIVREKSTSVFVKH